jgi:hypothetical protein
MQKLWKKIGWFTTLGIASSMAVALGQTDPLVSKSIPLIFADKDHLWAMSGDGTHYSYIDPFVVPVAIRNGSLPFRGPVRGGLPRRESVLLYHNYFKSDSETVAGIGVLYRDAKTNLDSLIFLRTKLHNNFTTLGIEVSALANDHDTLLIGAGRGGFARAKLKTEGTGILNSDSLDFLAFPANSDTAMMAFRCAVNKRCNVQGLDSVSKIGEPDSVAVLAVDSSAADSTWLLIGTHAGLRRGLIGGRNFPKVTLPADKPGKNIRIERIVLDSKRNILWVFSGSEYFFSSDHGLTFRKPPNIAAATTKPSSIFGFSPAPQAVNIDDTTFINFNVNRPGLVIFGKDSMAVNSGEGTLGDAIFDAEDGLNISQGEGQLTSLATVRTASVTVLAVGSTAKGIFLRKTGTGQDGSWTNINSLKRIKGGLDEIITYPTLFTGVKASGEPEYVNIGYRLKKDGKVTISVFNYAMEKVKTLVEGVPRKGGGSRSEVPIEDRWDGRDAGGRPVSFGTYYILVESNQGEKGWGKAIAVRGRNP